MKGFVSGKTENLVGMKEMLVTSIFSLPTVFSTAFFIRVVKTQNYVVKT